MKKIGIGYGIAAALLIIWAGADLYHYAVIGKGILDSYEGIGILHGLVRNSLVQAIVKLLIAAALIAIGYRKKKPNNKISAQKAVSLLLALGIGLTWIVSMLCLTVVAAQEIDDRLYDTGIRLPETISALAGIDSFFDPLDPAFSSLRNRPDALENAMLTGIARYDVGKIPSNAFSHDGSERKKLIRDIVYSMDTAVFFYDETGTLLHSSDENLLFFSYITQQELESGSVSAPAEHTGWIDLSEGMDADWQHDPFTLLRSNTKRPHSLLDGWVFRITGTMRGNQIIPSTMAYVNDWAFDQLWDQISREAGDASKLNPAMLESLQWQQMFDRTAALPDASEITLYAVHSETWIYPGQPQRYGTESFSSLAELTRSMRFSVTEDRNLLRGQQQGMGQNRLDDLLIFSFRRFRREGDAAPCLTMVTAARGNPLLCACSALRNLYIATFFVALLLFFIGRQSIRTHLIRPLKAVAKGMEQDWPLLDHPTEHPVPWQEAGWLEGAYLAEQAERRKAKNEIMRLQQALRYAKSAEQDRRLMVSAIAHELKTPLAVIHSYAEGLQAHIAEEKREQYLSVILSETERTDALVLEMLDYSRLAAGKVKLAQDDFSLAALTKSVLERLTPAAEKKQLALSVFIPETFSVTADEGRIAQVIENFFTNAIRYTAEGGQIRIAIDRTAEGTVLSVENECPPLSPETLARVWDTFYRADEARSSGGSGLGLAIAKHILLLHGGRCFAENTESGVKFGFLLPG